MASRMSNKYSNRARFSQRGLTLIEIMVALTLGLILLAGVLQIMTSNKQTFRVQEALSEIQENGRTAIRILSEDLRIADFWGCSSKVLKIENNLVPDGFGSVIFYPGKGLAATDGGVNPDTLTIQGAYGTGYPVLTHTDVSDNLGIASGNIISEGEYLLVTDCNQGDIFQNTSNAATTLGGSIGHATGGSVSPGNTTDDLQRVYDTNAMLFKIRQDTYSIGALANGEPGLIKNAGSVANREDLVQGVEDMQILFGEQVDATTGNMRYVDAGNVGNMDNVKSLRITLVVRSTEANVADAGDHRLRRTFSSTIGLRNRNP